MTQSKSLPDESFRDSIATIRKDGKRKWIYAKKPSGRLYNYRKWLSYLLFLLFFVGPFIKPNGQPLLLLNFFEREFIIFGLYLWPQDTYILFLMMITLIIFIILFTVVYGRIWCGWVCPQTIFLEMLFRRVEYWIEGDYRQQIKLQQQNWNGEKIFKKGTKNLIYIALSVLIISTLASYVVGFDKMKEIYVQGPAQYPKAFLAIAVFSFLFFIVFSWFREQVCLIVCPYGRLQGVLLDAKSIVVSYDYKRGEPRGAFRQGEIRPFAGKGDCINCLNCVHVCPTGIDIRNGTQLECVNCTACIDACEDVMKRVKLPTALIRLASQENIEKGTKTGFTWRTIAYSAVLLALVSALFVIILSRKPLETTIIRTPGLLYQTQEDGSISNLYNVKFINKTREDLPVEIRVLSHKGTIEMRSGNMIIKKQGSGQSVFFLKLNPSDLEGTITKVQFGVFAGDRRIDKIRLTFVGPIK